MGEHDRELGELTATLKAMHEDIKETKADVKTLTAFQAATEERLKNGNVKFQNHETRIAEVECKKTLTLGLGTTLITLGFLALGILVAIK